MIFWITFPNISIFLWISREPERLSRKNTYPPTILLLCLYYDHEAAEMGK